MGPADSRALYEIETIAAQRSQTTGLFRDPKAKKVTDAAKTHKWYVHNVKSSFDMMLNFVCFL